MNLLVLQSYKILNFLEQFKSESLGFYFSFFFHLFILLIIIGIPNFFEPRQIIVPSIIPIEIVNIDKITSIPKEINETKSNEPKKAQVKEKKFNASDNQQIKKLEIKNKPKNTKSETTKEYNQLTQKEKIVIKEKKEIPKELIKEKITIENKSYESLPEKKIKPKLKPQLEEKKLNLKSDISIEKKPKIESKSLTQTKPKTKPEPEFNIASMLKDLRNDQSTPIVENKEKEKKEDPIDKPSKEPLEKNQQLSISEIDLVLQQLSKCFIAPAGAKIKKSMFVKISAKIRQNRKVLENSIRIVDTNIPKSSPVYGPITESAMRTLLNPECIPLNLPKDKYNLWKNLTMTFDYSVMRGS